jgi:hypothetical protein
MASKLLNKETKSGKGHLMKLVTELNSGLTVTDNVAKLSRQQKA